jgi:hypothetical protein
LKAFGPTPTPALQRQQLQTLRSDIALVSYAPNLLELRCGFEDLELDVRAFSLAIGKA